MLKAHPHGSRLAFALSAGSLALFVAPFAFARSAPPNNAGQVFEAFDTTAHEDPSAYGRDLRAIWARDGRLISTSHFPGHGGPAGNFDWVIESGDTFVLDTTSTLITDNTHGATQLVQKGFVDVHDLWVKTGATLLVRGSRGCVIAASGNVRIDGQLLAKGASHPGVLMFGTGATQFGALGGPGGGRGGDGHPTSGQSAPAGSNGQGAFGLIDMGGRGGESGFSSSFNPSFRRPGGGGGGQFGPDSTAFLGACPDQTLIGLDAEAGSPGNLAASSAISGVGVRPRGGSIGTGPFVDGDPNNDFWGRMVFPGGSTIVGELSQPWAGAGGGGGGDACRTSMFPTTPYSPQQDQIGGGGGGGGGSLVIFALGDVVFGASGRIDASGGCGGGGENTNGFDHVGGAGGGGSGGHIVIQCASKLDFRACVGATPASGAGIFARGGQGGAGRDGIGGATANGVESLPSQDQLPPNAYGTSATCPVPGNNTGTIDGCGGDGGPGVIQLHVRALSDILVPNTGPANRLANMLYPRPVGSTEANIDTPSAWNRMELAFGPVSNARSTWFALPTSAPIDLVFEGTDATGRVLTRGVGINARVPSLPAIASGVLVAAPASPSIANDQATLVVDAASIASTLWSSNPDSLVGAEIVMHHAASTARFDVAFAVVSAGALRLTVDGVGTPLAAFTIGDTFELRPRFFRVKTSGVRDWLPNSASIRIEFQGAPADAFQHADETHATAWSSDVNSLRSASGLAFLRFRVTFDLSADGSTLSTASPRPSLEFLRVPFQY